MPRGPGKKENYNLDYSRFNYLDKGAQDDKVVPVPTEVDEEVDVKQDSNMPPIQEVLRTMPVELQEAFHLMSIAKANGDEKAQKRANELALKAVRQGGPQVQQDFIKTISEKSPEVAKQLGIDGKNEIKDPDAVLRRVLNIAEEPVPEEVDFDRKCDSLKKQMEAGAEAARKQMEALQQQQERMEQMKSPEDLLAFMQEAGLEPMDMQRILGGDQSHMESCVKNMLEKATTSVAAGEGLEETDQAIKAAEELHRKVCGGEDVAESAVARVEQRQPSVAPSRPSKPPEPPARTVSIPVYRLQYQKDAEGRYSAVELRCTLPGITSMADIHLDVSEDHMRLTTSENAPGYAVNAGPFPVPIEPGAARAKYSKRREELHIIVPAKGATL